MTKNKDYDKKIFRLISALNKLDAEGKVCSRKLAEEFNVNIRTVQRDLELLNMAGFLLDCPEKGLYTFTEGFSLKKMKLSNEEASLITVFYEITKSLGGNFEESFQGLLAKVLCEGHDSPFYIKMPDSMKIPKDYPFLKDLEDAIKDHSKVSIHYKSHEKEGDYKLCPLKIIFFDGFWYLLAHPEGKKWLTKFRLENIKGLEIVGGQFTPPANLKTVLDESVNILFPDKRDRTVLLKVSSEAARYFKRRSYFPCQKIKKENKDGSLIIESKISGFNEILPIIFRWIPNVSVIQPKELKREVENVLTDYFASVRENKNHPFVDERKGE